MMGPSDAELAGRVKADHLRPRFVPALGLFQNLAFGQVAVFLIRTLLYLRCIFLFNLEIEIEENFQVNVVLVGVDFIFYVFLSDNFNLIVALVLLSWFFVDDDSVVNIVIKGKLCSIHQDHSHFDAQLIKLVHHIAQFYFCVLGKAHWYFNVFQTCLPMRHFSKIDILLISWAPFKQRTHRHTRVLQP